MRPESRRPLRRFPSEIFIKLLLCAGNLLSPKVQQRKDEKRKDRPDPTSPGLYSWMITDNQGNRCCDAS